MVRTATRELGKSLWSVDGGDDFMRAMRWWLTDGRLPGDCGDSGIEPNLISVWDTIETLLCVTIGANGNTPISHIASKEHLGEPLTTPAAPFSFITCSAAPVSPHAARANYMSLSSATWLSLFDHTN